MPSPRPNTRRYGPALLVVVALWFVLGTLGVLPLIQTTSAQTPQDWGEWKPTPNFPEIEIRAKCKNYVKSSNESDWNYQFRNSYRENVAIAYRQESNDSTGHPPKYSSQQLFSLGWGEVSAVYDVYVTGGCNRGGVSIAVDRVETTSGQRISSSRPQRSTEAGAESTITEGCVDRLEALRRQIERWRQSGHAAAYVAAKFLEELNSRAFLDGLRDRTRVGNDLASMKKFVTVEDTQLMQLRAGKSVGQYDWGDNGERITIDNPMAYWEGKGEIIHAWIGLYECLEGPSGGTPEKNNTRAAVNAGPASVPGVIDKVWSCSSRWRGHYSGDWRDAPFSVSFQADGGFVMRDESSGVNPSDNLIIRSEKDRWKQEGTTLTWSLSPQNVFFRASFGSDGSMTGQIIDQDQGGPGGGTFICRLK